MKLFRAFLVAVVVGAFMLQIAHPWVAFPVAVAALGVTYALPLDKPLSEIE